MAKKQDLTENQRKFVDLLFEAMHDGRQLHPELLAELSKAAGYTSHWSYVFQSKAVKDAIYEGYKKHVSVYGLEAFSTILNIARNPDAQGKSTRLQLQAAQALLDASTIPYKGVEQQAEAATGVIVIPAKKKVVINVDEDGAEEI